jgi:hypothetical protein
MKTAKTFSKTLYIQDLDQKMENPRNISSIFGFSVLELGGV